MAPYHLLLFTHYISMILGASLSDELVESFIWGIIRLFGILLLEPFQTDYFLQIPPVIVADVTVEWLKINKKKIVMSALTVCSYTQLIWTIGAKQMERIQ